VSRQRIHFRLYFFELCGTQGSTCYPLAEKYLPKAP
jgi:hypothetical protein